MPTIKRLHPTLKACKCGFIGTKHQFYKHLDKEKFQDERRIYVHHGEVPLNEDDPRTKVEEQLERSLQ